MNSHTVVRTSPKGKNHKFIGTCIHCGMQNLTIYSSREKCTHIYNEVDNLVNLIKLLHGS